MTKLSARSKGCLTQRRRCPCGDEHCYIRVYGDEECLPLEPTGEQAILRGTSQTSHLTSSAESIDIPSPYVGQYFQSDDEAQEYYTNFARRKGFAIRRERSKGNAEHPLGVYKRELVCHRAGVSLPRKTAELKRQRNKKSSRCKCEAQMIIKKIVSKGVVQWVVVHFSNDHNHELLDNEEVRHLPAYRSISPFDRERILYYTKNGCTVNLIMRALEMEKGLKQGQLTFTERDLRNFLQSLKNINSENEGSELLMACKAMKDKLSDFRFEFTLDANNELEHIVWSYPDSIQAYKVYGDVVIFDTTYHLYTSERIFGVWFGLDNYGNTIFFGCVLLQDDKPRSFAWALQAFVRLMEEKIPLTMLTDMDFSLKDAISSEFPGTKHAFCIWNIISKLSGWFAASLGSQHDKFMTEFSRIYQLENVDEFEHQWSQLVIDFGLTTDRHIAILSYNRNYWASSYLRGSFLSLLPADFSISLQAFFKEFLNSETRLKDFVNQVAVGIDLLNQAAEEAVIRQSYQNVKIKSCTPIEEHAAQILTYHAFQKFQKEIVASTQYAAFEASNSTYLIRHHLKTDGGNFVRYITSEKEIHCSCKEFETSGILCGHALRVLSLKNVFQLPDKYVLIRWRRESSLFPKSTGYKYRCLALQSLLSIVIQESAITKDRFSYVQRHISKLLMHGKWRHRTEALNYFKDAHKSEVIVGPPPVLGTWWIESNYDKVLAIERTFIACLRECKFCLVMEEVYYVHIASKFQHQGD